MCEAYSASSLATRTHLLVLPLEARGCELDVQRSARRRRRLCDCVLKVGAQLALKILVLIRVVTQLFSKEAACVISKAAYCKTAPCAACSLSLCIRC